MRCMKNQIQKIKILNYNRAEEQKWCTINVLPLFRYFLA